MKELVCTACKKRVITERENTLHTDYSYGLCDECKPQEEVSVEEFSCPQCGKVCKSKLGLISHERSHSKK